jgi:GNAT superfamily N-acetyltransferase
MTIRRATAIDVPAMVELAERFHAESELSYVPFVRTKVERVFTGLLDYPYGLALVATRAGRVIGGMTAVAEPHFFSDALFSTDFGTFIAPEYRGGFVGPSLLRAYVKWAKALGVACINGGVVSGICQERAIAIFKRIGFAQTGVCFVYEKD